MEITKEYLLLFNAITDTVKVLDSLRLKLIDVQRIAEEMYINDSNLC